MRRRLDTAAHVRAMDFLAQLERGSAQIAAGGGTGSAFRSASPSSRTLRKYRPGHYSADAAILENLELLLARSRDQGRNSHLAIGVKNCLDRNVVGTGIGCKPAATDNSGEPLADFNQQMKLLWGRYCDRHVRLNKKQSLQAFVSLQLRDVVERGGALLLEVIDPKRPYGITWQPVAYEQLDRMKDRPRGGADNEIRGGVELDAQQTPVAYWILDEHPYAPWSTSAGRSQRVPAERIIHLYRDLWSDQVLGVTWLAPTLQNSRDFNGLVGDELTAARVGTLFTAAIKREHGAGTGLGLDQNDDLDSAQEDFALGAGTTFDIGHNDDVKIIANPRPSQGIKDFSQLLYLIEAMSQGISYVALTGDYAMTNYSSARAAHNDDRRYYRQLQAWIYCDLVAEVYRRFARHMILTGRVDGLSASVFRADPERWLATRPIYPGWEQVDELKETEAALRRIHGGLSTWEIELGKLGRDRDDVFRTLAEERAMATSLGLELTPPKADAIGPSTRRAGATPADAGDE